MSDAALPDRDALWKEVVDAARATDVDRLRSALKQYHTQCKAFSEYLPSHLDDAAYPGNGCALALELLNDPAPEHAEACARIVTLLGKQWKNAIKYNLERAHFQSTALALRKATDIKLANYVSGAVTRGNSAQIEGALKLFEFPPNVSEQWLLDAMTLEDPQRIACLGALAEHSFTRVSDITTLIAKRFARQNTENPLPLSPPIDAEALDVLLRKQQSQDPNTDVGQKFELLGLLLKNWPMKDLLCANNSMLLNMGSHILNAWPKLQEHIGLGHAPSAGEITTAATAQPWENRRAGIMQAYLAMHTERSMIEPAPSSSSRETYAKRDAFVLGEVSRDLKLRLSAASHNRELAATMHFGDELAFYDKMGMLDDITRVPNNLSGFSSRLEWQTMLREQLIPTYVSASRAEKVLETGCWAEYARHSTLNRPDSAIAAYTLGKA